MIKESALDLVFGKDFLDWTPKARFIKGKGNKLNSIKSKICFL